MLRKVRISNEGDSDFIEGESVSKVEVVKVNNVLVQSGKQPAQYKPQLLGITKASLATDSFLSAAAFQETTRVLSDASVAGRVDRLYGLKENIIMGNLIPCGTGADIYLHMNIKDLDTELKLNENDFENDDLVEIAKQSEKAASEEDLVF
jgi:DNA-directed RNA polymerase subunit beta'